MSPGRCSLLERTGDTATTSNTNEVIKHEPDLYSRSRTVVIKSRFGLKSDPISKRGPYPLHTLIIFINGYDPCASRETELHLGASISDSIDSSQVRRVALPTTT